VHSWFDLKPGLIDTGGIRIITTDLAASAPGIYSIENASMLTLADGLAGYDVVHQHPVKRLACGPAIVRVWQAEEPRLIDTDVAEPLDVKEGASPRIESPHRNTTPFLEHNPSLVFSTLHWRLLLYVLVLNR
jgi:hypothetical protein